MSRPMLAVLLALLLPASATAEQYYKWKDDNGVWNYSTVAPKDKASATVNIATGAVQQSEAQGEGEGAEGAARKPGPEGQPSDERSLADTADAMSKVKQTQSANCERARANVATLENNAKVQIGDKALSDEEQLQELQKARRQVEVFCNSR